MEVKEQSWHINRHRKPFVIYRQSRKIIEFQNLWTLIWHYYITRQSIISTNISMMSLNFSEVEDLKKCVVFNSHSYWNKADVSFIIAYFLCKESCNASRWRVNKPSYILGYHRMLDVNWASRPSIKCLMLTFFLYTFVNFMLIFDKEFIDTGLDYLKIVCPRTNEFCY